MRSGQPAVWRIDTYRDTREAQVIAELSGSETVQCIAEEIVGPLRAHRCRLRHGLAGYVGHLYQMQLQYQPYSPHPVYSPHIPAYRLEKSESVTGMSLKDP
jgi:hypothetical protein